MKTVFYELFGNEYCYESDYLGPPNGRKMCIFIVGVNSAVVNRSKSHLFVVCVESEIWSGPARGEYWCDGSVD